MNPFFKFSSLVLLFTGLLVSCSDDDMDFNPNSTPQFATVERAISSAPGRTVTFTADLTDEAGIRSVNLRYDPWFLNKTINTDSFPNTYPLRYSFLVPAEEAEGSSHDIVLSVTSGGGNVVMETVKVTLDADFVAPQVFINSPTEGATSVIGDGPELIFSIDALDRALKEIEIRSDVYNEIFSVSGATAAITKEVDIETPGLLPFTVLVRDESGNEARQTVTVNIVDEVSFPAMFLTDAPDGTTPGNALFGKPFPTVASTEEGEAGFVFTARYYAEGENAAVRFIPQPGAFSPYAFGAEAEQEGVLAFGTDASVAPIVLTEGSGYYEITMNLKDLTYTATRYEPDTPTFPGFYMVGQGPQIDGTDLCTSNVDGSAVCWNFVSGKPFDRDPDNPYRFSQTVTLADGNGTNQFIFTAQDTGWAPFWRLNSREVGQVNALVPGGGVELNYTDAHYGTYLITADTHLNTITAIPQ